MLRYTVLRLLVFLGCLAALWLVGLRDRDEMLLLVFGAGVLSALISIVALRRFREDYAAQLQARVEARVAAKRERHGYDEDVEDAEVGGVGDSRSSRSEAESAENAKDAEDARDEGTFR